MSIARSLLIVICVASCATSAPPPASSTAAPSQSVPASTAAASRGARPIRNGVLPAGTYQTLVFRPPMTVTLADDGWNLTAGEVEDRVSDFVYAGPGVGQESSFAVFRLGQTFSLFADPCNPEGGVQPPAAGNGREAVLSWLARFPLLGASAATPITIGGRQGVEVKLAIDEAALAKCPDQQAALWGNGDGVFSLTSGGVDRLILLDIAGQVILIPWSVTPKSDAATLEPKVRQALGTLTFADR